MKQLDTIRNHEWIPTEFDLENMPRVTQQLPTASAENFGVVYLLDGTQDGYVKSHFYKCVKDSDNNYYWSDLHVGRFTVGNCRNIRLRMFDDGDQLRVLMAWEDPDDVIVGSEITRWKKTVLVHQVGHMPLTVTDGTVMCTSETRNAYATFGTFSMTIADTGSRKHYFKLFPYSDDDAITNDDQNGRCAGYNYQITTDVHPYTLADDGTPVYRTYYKRTLDTATNLYVYTALEYNTTNFNENATTGFYEFKPATAYYSYQNSLLNWAGIQELVKNGIAEDYFPVGTILMLPYHGDYGQMAFEVVDFDNVEPYDANVKFTMTLQAKYLYSWWDYYDVGYVFDTNEKPAAKTNDVSRDLDKTYFIGIANASTGSASVLKGEINAANDAGAWYNYDKNITVSSSNYAQTGAGTIYVETVFDSYDAGGRDRVGTFNDLNSKRLIGMSNTYHTLDGNGNRISWSSGLFECELPYEHARFQGISVRRAAYPTDPRVWLDNNKGNQNNASTISGFGNTAELAMTNRMARFVWTGSTGSQNISCWNENTGAAVTISHYLVNGNTYWFINRGDGQWKWELRGLSTTAATALAGLNGCTSSLAAAQHNVGMCVRWEPATTDYSTGTTDSITTRVGAWDSINGVQIWEKRTLRYHETYGLYDDHGIYRWKPHTEFDSGPTAEGVEADVGGLCAYFGELYPASDLCEEFTNSSNITRYDDYGCPIAPGAKMLYATTICDYAYNAYALSLEDTSARAYTDHVLDETLVPSTAAAGASGWGPVTWPRDYPGAPRNNYYADRFIPVPRTRANVGREYVQAAKYYLPIEQMVSKSRQTCAYNAKTKYYTARAKYLRCATRDVERAYKSITLGAVTTDTYVNNIWEGFRYNQNSSWVVNFEKVCSDLLRFPTHDDVFMLGKKYWKVAYLPNVPQILGSGNDPLWVWYYRKEDTLPDGADRWVRAHRDQVATAAVGNNGAVGVMIPVEVVADATALAEATAGMEQDSNDSTLYWKTLTPGSQLYFNVPYFTAKSIAPGNFYAENLPTSSSAASSLPTLYAPTYFKIAQKIIPTHARIPYVVNDGGTLKFTDDGENFYDDSMTDFRGVSPTRMEQEQYVGTISGTTYTVKRGYGGTSASYYVGNANTFNENNTAGYYGYKYTDYFEGAVTSYSTQTAWDGTTVTGRSQCNLFFKQANFERVAYGNHVWAQSNVRAYLNGPFDTSTEYVETTDTNFITSRSYYKFQSGTGYVRLSETGGSSDANHFNPNDATYKRISTWAETFNTGDPVYVKLDCGIAVGARLDINQPSKYWDYGASPVMQYQYNNSRGVWEQAYQNGYNWWDPFPSVNNGLVYDKLAEMYCECYIDRGSAGISTLNIAGTVKNRRPWSNETSATDTQGGWANAMIVHEGNKTVRTRNRMPRQSFLHGFIDCQYKRTSDTTAQEGKQYFWRNLYGRYENITSKVGTANPYANGLYEENPTYKEDLQDAYDFLNAIVPVVNRNGLYGTIGAGDLYPRAGTVGANLGGTISVDKVWLMSTNQIAGGTGANNGVWEEWSGAYDGKWANFGVADENRYGLVNQVGHKYALKKWAICRYNASLFGAAGNDTGSSTTYLNQTRVKYSLTLGQHATNGYTDSTLAAQYWWLRSAGGDHFVSPVASLFWPNGVVDGSGNMLIGWVTAYANINYVNGGGYGLRLSPLITIG